MAISEEVVVVTCSGCSGRIMEPEAVWKDGRTDRYYHAACVPVDTPVVEVTANVAQMSINVTLSEWEIEELVGLVGVGKERALAFINTNSGDELMHRLNNLANKLNLSLQRARL